MRACRYGQHPELGPKPWPTPVFLITGASTGIGAATARHAVEAGWQVALAARSEDKLEALVQELGEDNALASAAT